MKVYFVTNNPAELTGPRSRILTVRQFCDSFLHQPSDGSRAYLVDVDSLETCDARTARDIACMPNVSLFKQNASPALVDGLSYGVAKTPVFALDPVRAGCFTSPMAKSDQRTEDVESGRASSGIGSKMYDFLFGSRRLRTFIISALLIPLLVVLAVGLLAPLYVVVGDAVAIISLVVIPISMVYGFAGIAIRLFERISGRRI